MNDYILIHFKNYDIEGIEEIELTPVEHKINKDNLLLNEKESKLDYKKRNVPTSGFIKIERVNYQKKIKNFLLFDNFIIPISFSTFYSDIFNTYKNNEQILHQFCIDIKRVKYIINGNNITDSETILDYFKYKFNRNIPSLFGPNEKMLYTILLLCTQSVVALPLEILQINIIDKLYYIFELDDEEEKEKELVINIQILNNVVHFLIVKNLKIVEFINNEPIDKFYINMRLELELYQTQENPCDFQHPEYILLRVSTKKI